jgi:hypothetical protein
MKRMLLILCCLLLIIACKKVPYEEPQQAEEQNVEKMWDCTDWDYYIKDNNSNTVYGRICTDKKTKVKYLYMWVENHGPLITRYWEN